MEVPTGDKRAVHPSLAFKLLPSRSNMSQSKAVLRSMASTSNDGCGLWRNARRLCRASAGRGQVTEASRER